MSFPEWKSENIMCRLFIVVCCLAWSSVACGQLAPWWVPEPGCEKIRLVGSADNQHVIVVTAQGQDGGESCWLQSDNSLVPGYYRRNEYSFDNEGDLCLVTVEVMNPLDSPSLVVTYYDPPLKFLDYPLTTGKTWHSSSAYHTDADATPHEVTLDANVIGPAIASTGIGPLDVIDVEITDSQFALPVIYDLNEQYGNVTGLTSTANCDVVPDAPTSWSELKATYR